ncbi:hypothetical protein cypCar_00009900 [Cyprinus carpio]|nr:hypothetical protein cypCar_00009900 [Cyprinus carpio]
MFVSLSECTCSEMAETSFSQDQFSCPVCLDLLKDPVTIPCGHSYCMSCITSYWDQEDQKGVYSCPQCRQTFLPRPALNKNTVLSEVVEQLKKTKLQASVPAGPEDVECDVCTVRKNKAVKSCLVCLNSYCQNHLQQHENFFKGKRHNLTEATGRLQEMICPTHNKLLEIYCHTDQQCICYLCTMDNHKNHDTVAAVVERTKKQVRSDNGFLYLYSVFLQCLNALTEPEPTADPEPMPTTGPQSAVMSILELEPATNSDQVYEIVPMSVPVVLEERKRKFQQKIQQRQKDLEELREAVESHKCSAQTAVKDSERIFTELIHSIERICSELKQRIREREKAAVSRAEGLMYRLEQEIDDLRRRHAELEQLSQTDDHIHFLQTFQSLDIPPESTDIPDVTVSSLLSFDDVRKSVSQLKEKLQDFCREEIDKISGKATYIEIIPTNEPKIREEFLQCRT